MSDFTIPLPFSPPFPFPFSGRTGQLKLTCPAFLHQRHLILLTSTVHEPEYAFCFRTSCIGLQLCRRRIPVQRVHFLTVTCCLKITEQSLFFSRPTGRLAQKAQKRAIDVVLCWHLCQKNRRLPNYHTCTGSGPGTGWSWTNPESRMARHTTEPGHAGTKS